MAKLNLFGVVAAMEEEDIGTSSSVANGDVAQNEVENIEAQNEVEEVAKLSSEIEQVASQIEEGIDEGEKLDEVIVEGEEVLENNEGGDVPEEAVEVAQEALSESILLLAGREGKKQFKPSLESYETNIQKLRVSLEAAKDFANNVWQKIKELFAKFVTMIKKFSMKISAMFDKGSKQADALAKVFAQRTAFDQDKVTDEFREKLASAYPTLIKSPGLTGLTSTNGSDHAELIKSTPKIVNEIISDGAIKPHTGEENFVKKYGVNVELSDSDEDKEVLIVGITRKTGIWYIGSKGTTGFEKIEVNSSNISNVNLGAAELVKAANNVKAKAKAYQAAVRIADSTLSSSSKAIDKLRNEELKASLDYKEKAEARKKANIAAKIATQTVFQAMAGAQDDIAGKLALLGLLTQVYKKA